MKLFLAAIALAVAVPAAAQPLSPLVGTWELVRAESVKPNGETLPLGMLGGKGQTGAVIYTADGWMAVQLAAAQRPQVSRDDPNLRNHPPERGAAIANSYYAYQGTYEVDNGKSVVRHFVKHALHPDEIGQVYERRYQINGDLLTLSTTPSPVEGEQRFNRLTWRRVKQTQKEVGK